LSIGTSSTSSFFGSSFLAAGLSSFFGSYFFYSYYDGPELLEDN